MIRLTVRMALVITALLLLLIPFYVTWKSGAYQANRKFVKAGFRLGCRILGIKVKTEGIIPDKSPLMVVSNHFSYLDIFALGGALPLCFTPKSEIASWPVLGVFSKITGCIFIDRRPSQTMNNKNILDNAIQQGAVISLFPEGTTNDGTQLLPFKSSFFSIAENRDLVVQPVSIIYTKLNNEPITMENRHLVGWYGDMEFFPHLIAFLQQRSLDVTLVFHAPVNGKDFSSRKELAGYCYDMINEALIRNMHPPPVPA